MRTMMSAMVLACLLAPQPGRASEQVGFPRHEVWLGFGAGTSPEQSIFNVPDDLASEPDVLLSLDYLFNIDARAAFGIHLYGGTETLPDMYLLPPGATSPVPASFDLDTYNIGVRLRHTFTRKMFSPYAWVGLNMAGGTLSNADTRDLDYSGYSVGIGPGVLIQLGRHTLLTVEGVASFGAAHWESEPFANSDSRDFNPGLLGMIFNIGIGWGRVQ